MTSRRAIALVAAPAVVLGALDRALALSSTIGLDVSNVSSLWLAAAFAAGAWRGSARAGALAGLACLVGVLAGYYGFMHVAEGQADGYYVVHVAGRWLAGALVGGTAFGALGARWSSRRSPLAAACLGACFALEPALILTRLHASVRIGEAVAGAALTAALLLIAHRRGTVVEREPVA